jgi:hypothetical protein
MIQFTIIDNEGIFVNFHNLTKELKQNFLSQVKDVAIGCIKDYATGKNWKTIGDNIHYKITDNQVSLFPSQKKANLISWLHSGTKDHPVAPKSASVLCWVPSGGSNAVSWLKGGARLAFSKGHIVRGIKPTYFFSITSEMESRINKLIQTINQT